MSLFRITLKDGTVKKSIELEAADAGEATSMAFQQLGMPNASVHDINKLRNSFANGRAKAEKVLNEKMKNVRMRNAITPERQEAIKKITKEIDELNKSIDGQTDSAKRLQLIMRKSNLETERRNLKS